MKKITYAFILFLLNYATVVVASDTTIFPSRLTTGDTVGLVAPGYRVSEDIQIQYAIERIQALGLKVKPGKSFLSLSVSA